MIQQIVGINKEYTENIIILNNCSTCIYTINYLKNTKYKVINNTANSGPCISHEYNVHIYNQLPDLYIMTDPDLEINKNIPTNFVEILAELSYKYNSYKVGFALDISNKDELFEYDKYHYHIDKYYTICELEKLWWEERIIDDKYELYNAGIDTTFCLVNKRNIHCIHIRIAGDFTCKHLPWYKNNPLFNIYDNYIMNTQFDKRISTIAKFIIRYTDENYTKIYKNNELFFIKNKQNDKNFEFWKNIYTNWENDTFAVFDKYLNKDKIFIDIGGWIGTTCMYGSRKSKHVYSIEADIHSFNDMSENCKINCDNNYTLINNAIFNIHNIDITFGKNKFLNNSSLNDSTSQIYSANNITHDASVDYYTIKTITLNNIIQKYNINPFEISLIKVDIEGGEENILDDLYVFHKLYNTPLYISFHYSWWNDKNLDRFTFLTDTHKNEIIANPFTSILFA
jgi:FkbM family methyltransferase